MTEVIAVDAVGLTWEVSPWLYFDGVGLDTASDWCGNGCAHYYLFVTKLKFIKKDIKKDLFDNKF